MRKSTEDSRGPEKRQLQSLKYHQIITSKVYVRLNFYLTLELLFHKIDLEPKIATFFLNASKKINQTVETAALSTIIATAQPFTTIKPGQNVDLGIRGSLTLQSRCMEFFNDGVTFSPAPASHLQSPTQSFTHRSSNAFVLNEWINRSADFRV